MKIPQYNGKIYIIKNNINQKNYIGKTSREIKARYREHIHRDINNNQPIHRAMLKYGIENFSIEVLEDSIPTLELLNEREQYWINKYNSLVPYGYNLNPGGDGGICYHNIGDYWAKADKKVFIEHQRKANKASQDFFKTHPEEFDKAQRKRIQGSLQWRINNPELAKQQQKEITEKAAQKNSIPIEKYDLTTGETLETFASASEASKITGTDASTIRKCCNKKLKGCTDKRDGRKYGWRNIK